MKNYLSKRRDDGFGFSLFDGFDGFDDFFKPVFFSRNNSMNTDIQETENGYKLSVDMPGFDKKDINLELNDGYLTVRAERAEKEEDKESFIKRERNFSCSRSFYVGEGVSEEEITARYNNGTLAIDIPKKENKLPPKRNIEIQ